MESRQGGRKCHHKELVWRVGMWRVQGRDLCYSASTVYSALSIAPFFAIHSYQVVQYGEWGWENHHSQLHVELPVLLSVSLLSATERRPLHRKVSVEP
jgi:hypothetical protein